MKTPVLCLPYTPERSLASLLAALPDDARDVLLCGPLPADSFAGLVAWIYHPAVLADWQDAGTYLGQEEDRAPTVALQRSGQAVRLRWASAWTGQDVTAGAMAAALARLDALLSPRFKNHHLNFASPVALGRHLMASAWRMDDMLVPPAPEEIRELLTTHSPQGRHECISQRSAPPLPALYGYDMRLAYLWCCKGLPYGPVEWVRDAAEAATAHKLHVTWEAPEGWAQIGLLPQRQQGWLYPRRGAGWIDRREYDLAVRCGWRLRVIDGLRWQREGALDRWADGLQAALRAAKGEPLVAGLLRRVALNTLGSLHRGSVKRYRAVPKGRESDLPAGNPTLRMSEDGSLYYWYDEQPVPARGLLYVHPEWTTTVWARCRARLAHAALQFPPEQIVALRQDCLFTTHTHPTWGDDGAIGRFRLKESYAGPLAAPGDLAEFEALRREAAGGGPNVEPE